MLQKKLTQTFKKKLQIVILSFFAFIFNYHYGFIGIMPMDNTVLYNGGFRVLNGFVPFTDYWLVTGPLLDYLNAFFFKILGINWSSYIIHSSIFNSLLAISTYFFLNKIGLDKNKAFFYSILFSILFYPVVGTPFVDHHSTFFLVIIYYLYIVGIYTKNLKLFILIPILFCLSFLSKQTPSSYGLLIFFPLLLIFFFFYKEKIISTIFYLFIGTIIAIFLVFNFFYFTNINITNFFTQYIFFASTVGDFRFATYDPKFFDLLDEFKFLAFFIFLLFLTLINLIKKIKSKKKEILLVLNILSLSFVLIFHQFYTLNQNYIFFLIPLLCAIFHLLNDDFPISNNFIYVVILICIFAVTKYHIRFNENQKFNELEKVDLSKAVDGGLISKDLKNLKWITHLYPQDPLKEVKNLNEIFDILKEEKEKKAIFTNYQFIAPSLNIYDYSPNQWHHPSVSFPLKENKYFLQYKNFFIDSLKKNEIKVVYETSEEKYLNTKLIINENCYKASKVGEMITKLELNFECEDLK